MNCKDYEVYRVITEDYKQIYENYEDYEDYEVYRLIILEDYEGYMVVILVILSHVMWQPYLQDYKVYKGLSELH